MNISSIGKTMQLNYSSVERSNVGATVENSVLDAFDKRDELRDFMAEAIELEDSVVKLRGLLTQQLKSGSAYAKDSSNRLDIDTSASDQTKTLDSVAAFSGISSGTINVNGTDITIDTSTESLMDILEKIDAVDGVSAVFDPASATIELKSTTRMGDLVLDDGSTSFLETLGHDTGTIEPTRTYKPAKRLMRSDEFVEALNDFVTKLNDFFGFSDDTFSEDEVGQAHSTVQEAIRKAVLATGLSASQSGNSLKSGLGFEFELNSSDFVEFDGFDFAKALEEKPEDLIKFLTQTTETRSANGFLAAAEDGVNRAKDELKNQLGSTALFVSRFV